MPFWLRDEIAEITIKYLSYTSISDLQPVLIVTYISIIILVFVKPRFHIFEFTSFGDLQLLKLSSRGQYLAVLSPYSLIRLGSVEVKKLSRLIFT
jgi:hypothetical protein